MDHSSELRPVGLPEETRPTPPPGDAGELPTPYEQRLRDWPYAVRQLFQTPRAALIEGHAVQLAGRALNVGRVTAFVGSGASAAYGRISWNDLIYAVQTEIVERARGLGPLRGALLRMVKLIEEHQVTRAGALTLSAAQQLTIFQMAEELDDAIRSYAIRSDDPRLHRLLRRLTPFRKLVMWLTHDDRGHAEQLLKDALLDRDLAGDQALADHVSLSRIVEAALWGAREADHGIDNLGGRRLPARFVQAPPPHRTEGPSAVASPDPPLESLALPAERYRFAAWLTRQAPTEREGCVAALADVPDDHGAEGQSDGPRRRRPRRHSVRSARDPLLILLADLRITRFLTTNYDHEIESLFADEGYRRLGQPSAATDADPMAEVFRDVVFNRETTGELAGLASRERNRSGWVVHLHGRADLAGEGEIIATEEDYRQRYTRPDEMRPVIDDTIRLAFGASPILFVGIGMDEMDLFRPLRQFMSTPSRIGDRVVIALLPKRQDPHETERRKIDLLQRYGVYTIHFGDAGMAKTGGDASAEPLKYHPWLEHLHAIKDAFDAALAPFDDRERFLHILERAQPEDADWTAYRRTVSHQHDVIENICRELRKSSNPLFVTADRLVLEEPTHIEGIRLDGARALAVAHEILEINDALGYLYDLVKAVQGAAGPRNVSEWAKQRRDGQAYKVQFSGALNALTTAALCARLLQLRSDWQGWRDQWQRLPEPRPAGLRDIDPAVIESPPDDDRATIERPYRRPSIPMDKALTLSSHERTIRLVLFRRHGLSLLEDPSEDPTVITRGHRFYAGAPSQTFTALLSALREQPAALREGHGRRICLFLARRGVGKGHFFAALQQPTQNGRLAQFLALTAPSGVSEYFAAFFNLSFSLEVTSIFDRIALFIFLALPALPEAERRAREDDWHGLAGNRIERLRFALRLWKQVADSTGHRPHPRRILLAFNAVNTLFDGEGKPKNRQFRMLFEALLDWRLEGAPIDLIFVSADQGLPEYFRWAKNARGETAAIRPDLAMRLLVRPGISAKDRAFDLQLRDHLRLAAHETSQAPHVAHLLHHARASAVVNAFFPSVSLIIARNMLRRRLDRRAFEPAFARSHDGGDQARGPLNVFAVEAAKGIHIGLKALLVDSTGWPADNMQETLPLLMAAAVLGFETGKANLLSLALRLAIAVRRRLDAGAGSPQETAARHRMDQRLSELADRFAILTDALPDRLEERKHLLDFLQDETGVPGAAIADLARDIDDELRSIHFAVGDRRFTLTLLFATAYEIFHPAIPTSSDEEERHPSGHARLIEGPEVRKAIDAAADDAMRFLHGVRKEVVGLRPTRRDDLVMTRVMERLKQLHVNHGQRDGARWLTIDVNDPDRPHALKTGVELYGLLEWILWHFAVICVPMEPDVLARCPLIRTAVDAAAVDPRTKFTDDDYEHYVGKAVELLVNRCLVYRLRPSREGDAHARFGIHRGLQRHILRKMGAPFVEYHEVDRFSLTLYASQPNDIPRLSPESHAQLRKTVWALSAYPENSEIGDAWDSTVSEDTVKPALNPGERRRRLLNRRKRMLRAAYGILRSIYSVASVARFGVDHERIDAPLRARGTANAPGFFEEHRQQVLWLIRQATELGLELEGDAFAPFYSEEIVWLYNECAVLSLVQGRLPDASLLFELANQAAERLEPDETGPLRTLILLNRSVAEIERGRVRSARDTLEQIIAATDGENDPEVHAIATGYLGLIHHLTGHVSEARRAYDDAVPALIKLQKTRAASIFARHKGDLLRALAEEHYGEAQRGLETAAQLSLENSHEDTRHLAMLALARLKLRDPRTSRSAEIHAALDEVEGYARVMGMPRLTSEVHEIRARLHERNGDFKAAGTVAMASLEIAALHELRLRRASVLTLMAKINLARSHSQAAQALLAEALVVIRDTGYDAASKAAQEVAHGIRVALHPTG